MTIAELKQRWIKLQEDEAEARARGDIEKAAELDAEADELGEYIYRKERGGRYDPEVGGWVYPDYNQQ